MPEVGEILSLPLTPRSIMVSAAGALVVGTGTVGVGMMTTGLTTVEAAEIGTMLSNS